jgi:putative DNA primase/helicase
METSKGKITTSEAEAAEDARCSAMSTLGTPEHREETIKTYMTKGTHLEPRMSRKEAEAYYQWAFPALSEKEVQEVHARQNRGIFVGPFDSLEDQGSEWFVSGEDFLAQNLGTRAVYLSDKETGATVFYEASLNQIFATRGLGKSIVTNALLKCLIGGKEFLRLKSDGGLNVLLVDAELPPIQLQERLKQFGEAGQLTLLSPYTMTDSKDFPNLSQEKDQQTFLGRIDGIRPQVIIFDTLTRCFRFNTNDSDAWLRVNDFLTDLRSEGYCVLLVHHEGKNGTQRGRTDGDDNLDVSIQLEKPYGWQPGDGLGFKWKYSKVRHGGHLPDFEAAYDIVGGWQMVEDSRLAEVMNLHKAGKSTRVIATSLDMSQTAVSRLIRKANQAGLAALNAKAGGESPSQ